MPEPMSAERLREIRERQDGLLVAGIEDFKPDAADLLAEVERLRWEIDQLSVYIAWDDGDLYMDEWRSAGFGVEDLDGAYQKARQRGIEVVRKRLQL